MREPVQRVAALVIASSLVAAAGCTKKSAEGGGADQPKPNPNETGGSGSPLVTNSATTGGTGESGTPIPVIDCAAVPDEPISVTELAAPRGYHDVAFDQDGWLIGSDNSSLIKVMTDGTWQVFVPNMGVVQGMDWLPNGDLAVARDSDGSLVRVTPAGGSSVITTDVHAYGVIVGPDGTVYVANTVAGKVQRVDPDTGAKTVLINEPGLTPRVVNFSPDFTKLYIGTLYGDGKVYVVDLDANLDPMGSPTVFARDVGTGDYHDSLGVDACGNLYISDYSTSDLYRITPDGESSRYHAFSHKTYGHGLEWGSGIGGWNGNAVYLPQPYDLNTVVEVDVGVPSRTVVAPPWP